MLALALVATLLGCTKNNETNVVDLHPTAAVLPETLAFDDTIVDQTTDATVDVANVGRDDLHADLTLEGDGAGAFSIDQDTLDVTPDGDVMVTVTFAPTTYLDYAATLKITTDDPDHPEIDVPITGTGIHAPTPDIDVDPLSIDFGTVASSGTSVQYLSIDNVGDGDLHLGTTTQTGSGAFHFLTDPSGATVAAGSSLPVVISYQPTMGSGDNGTFTIPSDDPDEPSVTVTLLGNGGGTYEYPVAAIDCDASAEPPEWVKLDGRNSYDPQGGALTYSWTLASKPDGSQAQVEDPATDLTRMFADVAGTYVTELVVTNTAGVSSAPAKCTIEAVPKDALHVELTWSGNDSDLDLHLLSEGGAFFDEPGGDCNFCNPNPDWGTTGVTDDDPRLDLDDRSGLGPENINILAPSGTKYEILVHYYETYGDGDVTATVRVYTYGILAATYTKSLSRNELWDVGQVNWPDGTVGTIDTTSTPVARVCF